MVTFKERPAVQKPILKYAIELGWEYIKPDNAIDLRKGETGILFEDILKQKLYEFNPWLDEDLVNEILKDLKERRPGNILGNRKILGYLKGTTPFYSPKKKRDLNIRFIDFEKIENNIFQVSDELFFTNGKYHNRFDTIFYINGLPVILTETKNPEDEEAIPEALVQINRYHNETPEYLTFPLLFVATNLIEFRYGSTWNLDERCLYYWRNGNNFEELVKSFFDKQRILSFIGDYVVFWEKGGEINKIILNFHQIRAVEKIVLRILGHEKKSGLIWHTQGSGKTLTMIVAANRLRKLLENPTLIMVVDRNELEEQLLRNLKNYGFPVIEIAESKRHLKTLIAQDYKGLILTTIQKFAKVPADLNQQENIIVFADEAHRSHEGKLGIYMKAALPKAFFFGFTGTPIDKTATGKGTFITFGKEDPPQGYLDKYSILDSLHDKTTVPINYTLAPSKFLVPTDLLEKEFFELLEGEAIADIDELDKKILQKAVNIRNFLKSKDRVPKVAQFVAKHFKENIEPMGFKALLVGVDREACALLKQELDKFLPEEYSCPVYTPDHNDPAFMKQYYLSDVEEKEIKKNFLRPNQLPKILIVTSKLLTGFDAPILYAIYLDKPMRDHTLLQAIARVNRPYEGSDTVNKKTAGLIVDFIGIFEKLQKALVFDSTDIEGVVQSIEKVKEEFEKYIKAGKTYIQLVGGKIDDKAVEKIIDYFINIEKRKEFIKYYKELTNLYEIISPDPFLRPYLDDYFLISSIHRIVRANFGKRDKIISARLMRKTSEMIRERTKTEGLKETLPIYPIDERTIRILQEDSSTDAVKIINIHRSITIFIEQEGVNSPFLFSLKEGLEQIIEAFEKRQIDTKETLIRLEGIIKNINSARSEIEELDIGTNQFAIFWVTKTYIDDAKKNKELSIEIDKLFNQYPNWFFNNEELRILKAKMLGVLLKFSLLDYDCLKVMEKILDLKRQVYARQNNQ